MFSKTTKFRIHKLNEKNRANNIIRSYPLVLLRETLIFPNSAFPIYIKDTKAIKAIDIAIKNDNLIFMSHFKNTSKKKKTYSIGVIGYIHNQKILTGGQYEITIEGLTRGRILNVLSEKQYHLIEAEDIIEQQIKCSEANELVSSFYKVWKQYVSLNEDFSSDMIDKFSTISELSQLTDTVVYYTPCDLDNKQNLLETSSSTDRLSKIIEFLKKEIEFILNSKVKEKTFDELKKNEPDKQEKIDVSKTAITRTVNKNINSRHLVTQESVEKKGHNFHKMKTFNNSRDIKEDLPLQIYEEESDAIMTAYNDVILKLASVLKAGLSALVKCDKIIVEHLWRSIAQKANLRAILFEMSHISENYSFYQTYFRHISMLRERINALKQGEILIIPHLDLLTGGAEMSLSDPAREVIELLYGTRDNVILAFSDISIEIPTVLSNRFSICELISGVGPHVNNNGKDDLIGNVILKQDEIDQIINFDPEALYKHLAGMNPIQIRHSVSFAFNKKQNNKKLTMQDLYEAIREFKVESSDTFLVPDEITFDDIGGYDEIKDILKRTIKIIDRSINIPNENLRSQLLPRGFIFHGPPGTGKTLFAKALANKMNATIMIISGSETNSKWFGESERKIRNIFSQARRNAPSIIVFDEFDAIASKRSREDGNRASNAVVAQILTEMDGFRPDVPILVIGTTNRIEIVDKALLRPSRFQPIEIGMPDAKARQSIVNIHAQKYGISLIPELIDIIAKSTNGFNCDEIRSIFRDACIYKLFENKSSKTSIDAKKIGELIGRIRFIKERYILSSHTDFHHLNQTQRSNHGQQNRLILLTD